ncbi:hypothetical protein [Pseudomonas sp. DC3000-4b1]|uniref:PA0061/PA0062 family lipoprotein n=1 Tax=unclassified Pseudomonas TaxID=196821 RepID=UPI003CF9F05C
MRRNLPFVLFALLGACSNTPVPTPDPAQAWVQMFTRTGKMVMAERLDGQRLEDGRFFQVRPGAHELRVRFDYEVTTASLPMGQPSERICYVDLRYDNFKAGQRYRLEARNLGLQTFAFLYDAQGATLATERQVNCLF